MFSRRRFGGCLLPRIAAFVLVAGLGHGLIGPVTAEEEKGNQVGPNVVVIFADDLGYGDLGCYGATKIKTPHLDQLAAEGVRFADFHVAAAVCSSSRAALLSGCYPQRVSIMGALGPADKIGIHENEVLLPQLLKTRGYATAIFGKWHLGHRPEFLPTRHGFDEYYGLPYSNDMWPQHPTSKFPPLPLMEGEKTIAENPDQTKLTTSYTERAVQFIERNKTRPFFLYVPHNMPHVPLHVSDKFKGKSAGGLYGDVIEELDWSVGQITGALKAHGLAEKTLVLFTSDNGPWLSYGPHGGSAGPLREGKGTAWEGGMRVPMIARWSGKIPAGKVCGELCTTMDILPTIARLAGTKPPTDRIIDGHDIRPLLTQPDTAKTPYEVFYQYWLRELVAVRRGPWKLVLPHNYVSIETPGKDGKPGKIVHPKAELALYNLAQDIGESKDVAAAHPEVVKELQALAEKAREDLGDKLANRVGKNVRPAGKAAD